MMVEAGANRPIADVRRLRDDIERRVTELALELDETAVNHLSARCELGGHSGLVPEHDAAVLDLEERSVLPFALSLDVAAAPRARRPASTWLLPRTSRWLMRPPHGRAAFHCTASACVAESVRRSG